MSLHNSTIIENRNGLFLIIVDIKEAIKIVLFYKFKAQRSGFEFERRNSEAKRSFRPGRMFRAETERADADSDEVKLIRAQGECLGIRSR